MTDIIITIIVFLMFSAILYVIITNSRREFNCFYVGQRVGWREEKNAMVYEITDLEHDDMGNIRSIKVQVSPDDIREFTFSDYLLGTIYRAE